MTVRIAIGIGCRRGCPADAIEALVRQVLDRPALPETECLGLFTIDEKSGEAGLIEAARRLGFSLTFLGRDALCAQSPRVQTRSVHAENRFGVPSVAEAAALAGAGADAVLVVPRIAGANATCAVAASQDHPT